MTKNHIDSVEWTMGQTKSKMPIEAFHAHLFPLRLLRIDEPIISQRTCPTSSDINQMLVNALKLKEALENQNTINSLMETDKVACKTAFDMMQMELRACNEAKQHKIEYRNVESALLKKFLKQIRERIGGYECRAKQRELSFYMDVEQFENLQNNRYIECEKALREASEASDRCQPMDMAEFNDHFDKFAANWEAYMKNMETAHKSIAEVEEYNASVAVKRNLNQYFNKSAQIDQFIGMCDKYADAYQRGFEGIHRHDDWKRAQNMIQNTPKLIKELRIKVNYEMAQIKQFGEESLDIEIER